MSVAISNLRVRLDEHSLIAKKPRVLVEGLTLRVSQESLSALPLADGKAQIERLTGGIIRFSASMPPMGATGELRPSAAPNGRARFELVTLRAAGLLPLPKSMALGFIHLAVERMRMPGVYFPGNNLIEIDLAVVIAHVAAQQAPGVEIRIGPLQALRAGEGVLELVI